jgi:hypothetical protein
MKITDYITDNSVLNKDNIFTLQKYEQIIKYLHLTFPDKYIILDYNQHSIHSNSHMELLQQTQNKIILISNLDFDFPPPLKPYEYDAYFNKSLLPNNYKNIPYIQKINTNIIKTIEKNNIKIYAHAVSVNHPNITMIPAGIYSKFNHFYMKTNEKKILCYANFGLSCDRWFGNPRNEIYKDFITKENIYSTEVVRRDCLSEDMFYKNISESKFAICPRGCGIDSYRIYDCICLGCIPIVEKYDGYEKLKDLPILFINSYKDYNLITEEYLNNMYINMMKCNYNYDKLTVNYWFNCIHCI